MERLSEDELIMIAQKVAEHGTQHLMNFMRTSKTHERISKLPTVLRVLPPEYVNSFNHNEILFRQLNFLNMMIESGHANYCLLRAVSIMYNVEPDVVEVRRVLKIASAAEVEAANYFLMLLDASAEGGEEVEGAISTFTKFFKAKRLGELRLSMVGWGTPYWIPACSYLRSRPMPDGLVLRTLCQSKDTCKGNGRLPDFHWPAPGDDYEYSQTEVCIQCRFDTELYSFWSMFNFVQPCVE